MAEDSFKEISPLLEKYNSFQLHFMGYNISVARFTCLNKYAEALPICDEAITLFKTKPFECKNPISSILHQKIICHTQLKQYEAGKKAIKESLELVEEGTINWYRNLELQLFLCFHTLHFEEAYLIYRRATESKHHKYLQETYQETWKIVEAYLFFANRIGQSKNINFEKQGLGKFKLNKFINEIPVSSKDKKGKNIPIIIVQILLMITEKMYDRIFDRLEALEKYRQRHIGKEDVTYRSNQFISALHKIVENSFQKTAVKESAAPIIEEMQTVEINIAEQGYYFEFLPFEDVWDFILAQLEDS